MNQPRAPLYIRSGDSVSGPYSRESVAEMLRLGAIPQDAFFRQEDSDEWVPLSSLGEPLVPAPPSAPPADPVTPTSVSAAAPRPHRAGIFVPTSTAVCAGVVALLLCAGCWWWGYISAMQRVVEGVGTAITGMADSLRDTPESADPPAFTPDVAPIAKVDPGRLGSSRDTFLKLYGDAEMGEAGEMWEAGRFLIMPRFYSGVAGMIYLGAIEGEISDTEFAELRSMYGGGLSWKRDYSSFREKWVRQDGAFVVVPHFDRDALTFFTPAGSQEYSKEAQQKREAEERSAIEAGSLDGL